MIIRTKIDIINKAAYILPEEVKNELLCTSKNDIPQAINNINTMLDNAIYDRILTEFQRYELWNARNELNSILGILPLWNIYGEKNDLNRTYRKNDTGDVLVLPKRECADV